MKSHLTAHLVQRIALTRTSGAFRRRPMYENCDLVRFSSPFTLLALHNPRSEKITMGKNRTNPSISYTSHPSHARDRRVSAIRESHARIQVAAAGHTTANLLQSAPALCSIFAVVYELEDASFRATWGNANSTSRIDGKLVYNRKFAAIDGAQLQHICGCMGIRGSGGLSDLGKQLFFSAVS